MTRAAPSDFHRGTLLNKTVVLVHVPMRKIPCLPIEIYADSIDISFRISMGSSTWPSVRTWIVAIAKRSAQQTQARKRPKSSSIEEKTWPWKEREGANLCSSSAR